MSTSPSRAPDRERAQKNSMLDLQPFPYDTVPAGTKRAMAAESWPDKTAQEAGNAATREAQARAQGRQEGQAEARKYFEEQLAKERSGVAAGLSQFTRDRAAYFQKVEAEVVQLALNIARKILHREAQVDPLLLAGIVRVALEKIDGATGVVLRINPQNGAEWRRYLSTRLEPPDVPEIIEDPAQPVDSCALETSMGTARIGLDVQFKEIEQGLMDLLAVHPGAGR